MNNRRTQEDFFNKIYVPLTLLQGFEKGYSRFACERELETEQKLQYFDPHSYGRQCCVFLVLLMLNRRPWGPLCWVLAFFTASYQQLLWSPNSIGVPEGLFGRVWLSLPHLVYNSVRSRTGTSWLLSWLSYIIVDRLLDLWNGMIDRHPAEITVMQFTGHSLQSMSESWALPCPISSAKSTHTISFDYWPLECVTSFRCITL